MSKAIIAIGGGLIRTRGTEAIDREIIRASNRKHPRVLLVPTASGDDDEYWQRFRNYYGGFLQCKPDVLRLRGDPPAARDIERKIFSAEIVYVGGGNTLHMMRVWRRLGVDEMLRAAHARGVVMAGLSAGSICWFDSGHSDSMSFYNPKDWKYINVRGLGLIRGVHCPHYNSSTAGVPRRKNFQQMMRRIGGIGIAIENNCAIEFVDGSYRVLRSKPNARAYRVRREKGVVIEEQILAAEGLAPVETLYDFRSGGGIAGR